MKKLIILVIFLTIYNMLFAQNDAVKLYQEAVSNFEKSNYTQSISLSKKAVNVLGRTNPKLQSLLVYSYFSLGDFTNSKIEMIKYFKVLSSAEKKGEAYNEMVEMSNNIDLKLNELKVKQENERKASYEKFLSDRKNKKELLENSLMEESAEALFDKIRDSKNISDFQTFISLYPNSSYTDDAKRIKSDIEITEKYNSYIKKGDDYFNNGNFSYALTNYLAAQNLKNDLYSSNKICLTYKKIGDTEITNGGYSIYAYKNAITNYKMAQNCNNSDIELINCLYDAYKNIGDKYFGQNEYVSAIENYKYGLHYKPYDSYLNEKIRTAENLIYQREEKKVYEKILYLEQGKESLSYLITEYSKYLLKYPEGENAEEASKRLKHLKVVDSKDFFFWGGSPLMQLGYSQLNMWDNNNNISIKTDLVRRIPLFKSRFLQFELNMNVGASALDSSYLGNLDVNVGFWFFSFCKPYYSLSSFLPFFVKAEDLEYTKFLYFYNPGISVALPFFNSKKGSLIVSGERFSKQQEYKLKVDNNTGQIIYDRYYTDTNFTQITVTDKLSGYKIGAELAISVGNSSFLKLGVQKLLLENESVIEPFDKIEEKKIYIGFGMKF
jgi:hypothetical protein